MNASENRQSRRADWAMIGFLKDRRS